MLIKKYNIITKRLLVLKPLRLTNGLLSSFITHYFIVKIIIGHYTEFILFYIIKLLPLILVIWCTLIKCLFYNNWLRTLRLLELLLYLAQKDQTNQKNPKKHPDNPLRCMHYRGGTGRTTVVRSYARPPDPYLTMAPHNNNKDGRIPH